VESNHREPIDLRKELLRVHYRNTVVRKKVDTTVRDRLRLGRLDSVTALPPFMNLAPRYVPAVTVPVTASSGRRTKISTTALMKPQAAKK